MNQSWTLEKIHDTVKILPDNEIYRVSDVLKFTRSHTVIKYMMKNKSTYGNTLLYKYFKRKHKSFYHTLKQAKEKTSLIFYGDNCVLLHLRMGDVIGGSDSSFTDLNKAQIFKELEKYQGKSVVIVTALHYGHKRGTSKFYPGQNKFCYNRLSHDQNITELYTFIRSLNNHVIEILSHTDIDTDLMHMTFCKNLITLRTSGGFSRLANMLHTQYLAEIKDDKT